MPKLYHFSEDPSIEAFTPHVPEHRHDVDPRVWAIDEWHSPMYFFPRQCPRILLWRISGTTEADVARWWHHSEARMLAHIESCWLDAMRTSRVYRYDLPAAGFEDLHEAGMYVSRQRVEPLRVEPLGDLIEALERASVELRLLPSLEPLRDVWQSSLHASGIRLRNAQGWNDEPATGSPPRPPATRP